MRTRVCLFIVLAASLDASAAPGPLPGLPAIDDVTWDTTAVRKVLHTFAFGGHAADAQISRWASVPATTAIVEMLNFDEHNLRLSQPSAFDRDGLSTRPQTLRALSEFWSSNGGANAMPAARRNSFARADWSGAAETWTMAARARGGNPFRHKIGLWETNYHLAVNQLRGVTPWQLVRMYDDMLGGLAAGHSYDAVTATGSMSAAVARQYGHEWNWYADGQCYCNEDFAREFHQLGFGILGSRDKAYHERTSIKNTAKILTGMEVVAAEAPSAWEGEVLRMNTAGHVPGAVEVLHRSIAGATMAQKLRALAAHDIAQAESLANLPVMIVQTLANDRPTAAETAALRQAWASMPNKDLLRFLRAYAVSPYFHSASRIKQSSRDHELAIRAMEMGNRTATKFQFGNGWGGRLAHAAGGNVVALTTSPRRFAFGPDPARPLDLLAIDKRNLVPTADTREVSLPDVPDYNPDWYGTQDYLLRALKQYYPERRKTLPVSSVFRQFADHEAKLRSFGELIDCRLANVAVPSALAALMQRAQDGGFRYDLALQMRNLHDALACSDLLKLRVASLEFGGWDTHNLQRSEIEPNLQMLFGRSGALHSLYDSLPAAARSRLVLVIGGEFGRQLKANGGGGTDHGDGSITLVIGEGVRGGVYGTMFPAEEIARVDVDSADTRGLNAIDHVFGAVCERIQAGSKVTVFPNAASAPKEAAVDFGRMFT